jgi:hypothetical protein
VDVIRLHNQGLRHAAVVQLQPYAQPNLMLLLDCSWLAHMHRRLLFVACLHAVSLLAGHTVAGAHHTAVWWRGLQRHPDAAVSAMANCHACLAAPAAAHASPALLKHALPEARTPVFGLHSSSDGSDRESVGSSPRADLLLLGLLLTMPCSPSRFG